MLNLASSVIIFIFINATNRDVELRYGKELMVDAERPDDIVIADQGDCAWNDDDDDDDDAVGDDDGGDGNGCECSGDDSSNKKNDEEYNDNNKDDEVITFTTHHQEYRWPRRTFYRIPRQTPSWFYSGCC